VAWVPLSFLPIDSRPKQCHNEAQLIEGGGGFLADSLPCFDFPSVFLPDICCQRLDMVQTCSPR
jgi:hypothetical protein